MGKSVMPSGRKSVCSFLITNAEIVWYQGLEVVIVEKSIEIGTTITAIVEIIRA